MKITQNKKFTINLGEYESYSFGGEVTIDSEEFPDLTPEQLSQQCGRLLEEQLVESVQEASELTRNKKSILYGATTVPNPNNTSKNGEAVNA
jgi:hypothetical protein